MKAKITFSIVITLLVALIVGTPTQLEPILLWIFQKYSCTPISIDFTTLLSISFLGVVVFILSTIGKFEEHKINTGFRNHYNRQINLLNQLSNVSVTYFIYLILILFCLSYYKDPLVIQNLKSVIFSLMMVTNLYTLMLLLKILIFEPLFDDYEIESYMREYGFRDSYTNLLGN